MATTTRYRDISKQGWSDWLGDHRKKLPTFGVYAALSIIGFLLRIVINGWPIEIAQLPLVIIFSVVPPFIWALITLLWKIYITPYQLLVGAEEERDKLKKELTDIQRWEALDEILYRYIELGEQLLGFADSIHKWASISEVHDRFGHWVSNTHDALEEVRPEWASRFHTDGYLDLGGQSTPDLCEMIRGFIKRLHQIRKRHEKRHPTTME